MWSGLRFESVPPVRKAGGIQIDFIDFTVNSQPREHNQPPAALPARGIVKLCWSRSERPARLSAT